MKPQPKTFEVPGNSKITEEKLLELVEVVDGIDIRTFRRNLRMLTFYALSNSKTDHFPHHPEFLEVPLFLVLRAF